MIQFVLSEELKLDVSIKIETYEYFDAFVVGDAFYYKINLTNPMSEEISDNFSVSVYNPRKELMEQPKVYEMLIEPNKSIEIILIGGRENETGILSFDTTGDYSLVLDATKSIEFYRHIKRKYMRFPKKFVFYFDVMPKWQYSLWREEANLNQKMLDLTKGTKEATIDMNSATKIIKTATNVMKWVAIITLGVAIITLIVTCKKKKKGNEIEVTDKNE